MQRERVYQAATRLGVSSRRLLRYLDSQALPHRSASSSLSVEALRALSGVTASDIPSIAEEQFRSGARVAALYWQWEVDDDYWSEESYIWLEWMGPDELSTAQAAAAYRVRAATIRQWVRRGHLVPLRREGRTLIFDARAVNSAALATGDRNKQPGGPLTRRRSLESEPPAGSGLNARLMDRLVTAEVAARAVNIAPSTIRAWRSRGHLRPATFRGHTPLYKLNDVVVAARRPKHRPMRKPKPLI